jgi:polyferredoxin
MIEQIAVRVVHGGTAVPPPPAPSRTARVLSAVGAFLHDHGRAIRLTQWVIVLVYLALMVLPLVAPLPDRHARILSHITLFAQFMFWGVWWPFVLLSMVLFGRIWCGVLCPEGTLSEFASRHGRGGAIPRWMRWGGWPFVAFAGTTIYGQLVSVYQYPGAVLVVLGGSTVAAMIVGYLYGRDKRVWCKYLCPVNGVFNLLSRLAPMHMKVNATAYVTSPRTAGVNCAPLVPLRHMVGASDCHMCGRCEGYRGAIALSPRSPTEEVVVHGDTHNSAWHSGLIAFGMLGLAMGAFHWSASPWFVAAKIFSAQWLAEHDIAWMFNDNIPWFILTHYPDQNDVFNWLDGSLILGYILATAVVMGSAISVAIGLGSRLLGKGWTAARFHHLMQALIPIGGCGLFIGLSASTVTLLRSEGLRMAWVPRTRIAMLAGATVWSLWLAWKISGRYTQSLPGRVGALAGVLAALGLVNYAWALMFWIW